MALRLIRDATKRPARCAFLVLMTNQNEQVGFFDFGTESWGGDHSYCSYTAFRQMAAYAGYVHADTAKREVAELRELLEEAERGKRDAEKALEAVEVLRATGFQAGRKPGRKPREMVA